MPITKARQLAEFIANADVDSDEIATGAVSASKLAATLDLSSKTIVLPDVAAFNITSGDVGIGTANPAEKFHIASSSGNTILNLQRTNTNTTGTVGALTFTASDGHVVAAVNALGDGNDEGADLQFRTTSAASGTNYYNDTDPRMTIKGSGLIGIGTTSPVGTLHLHSADTAVRLTSNQGSNTPLAQLQYSGSGGYFLRMGDSSNNEDVMIRTYGNSHFNGGNVGIGTTSPSTKLHVKSGGAGNSYGSLYLEIDTATNYPAMVIQTATGGNTTETHGLYIKNTANGFGLRIDDVASDTSPFVVDAGGNVGIGTTSPSADYGSDVALEISGATSPGLVINDTGQGSKYGIHADSNDLKVTYGSDILTTFQNDGDFGIGTSNPVAKLVVSNGGAEGWEIDPALIGSNHNRITNYNRSTNAYCSLTTDAASFIHRINGSNNEKLEFVSNGLNLKSATYAILNVQTDVDDNSTSNDGIIKISNGSSGTTKAEFRWDESEDKVHISYGDHGRHISIQPNGRVGIGTSTGSINNFLHLKSAASGGPQIEIESTSGTANSAFIGFDGTSLQLSTQRDMVDGSKRDTGKSWGGINIVGEAAGSKILFATSEGNNNSATTKMMISKEGKVLIGDTTSNSDDLLQIETPANGGGQGIHIRRNDSNSSQMLGRVMFGNNSVDSAVQIRADTDGAVNNGKFSLFVANAGGSYKVLEIGSSKNVQIEDGNLILANGHGIDFGATSNSSGSSVSELLSDYEHGTWTPTIRSTGSNPSVNYNTQIGEYIRVGRLLHINFYIYVAANRVSGGSGYIKVGGLPFSVQGEANGAYPHITAGYVHTGGAAQANLGNNVMRFQVNATPSTELSLYSSNNGSFGTGAWELSGSGTLPIY